MIDTWVHDGQGHVDEWPKAAALRLFLAEHNHRRVVIVDDEMEPADALAALTEREHLLVTPDHNLGVTLGELGRITGLVGGGRR